MKSHAFVRSNVGKILRSTDKSIFNTCQYRVEMTFFQCFKIKDESEKPKPSCIPEFSKYLYFMFAPTLVYRDHYPRTTEKKIRWGLVFSHFGEVFGAIVYTYCLFDRYCVPVFRELKVKELDFKSYVHLISVGSLFN